MPVYFDNGVFIDFLSAHDNSFRTTDRRERTPAELEADAERLI